MKQAVNQIDAKDYSASTLSNGRVLNSGCSYPLELTVNQFYLIRELLSNKIRLHAQNGKKQIIGYDTEIKEFQLQRDNDKSYLVLPCAFDSVSVQCDSLPNDIIICDIDDPVAGRAIWGSLTSDLSMKTIVEETPRGGVHIWGRVQGDRPASGPLMSRCGIKYEGFTTTKRCTIIGPNRVIRTTVSFDSIPLLPEILRPAPLRRLPPNCELPFSIKEGNRYNTLSRLVTVNPFITAESVGFIAKWVCEPPWDDASTRQMLSYLNKKQTEHLDEGVDLLLGLSLEARAIGLISPQMRDRWLFRLPLKKWYRYSEIDQCWKRTESTDYDFDNFLREQLLLQWNSSHFTLAEKSKLSTRRFREVLSLGLEPFYLCVPNRKPGISFRNGRCMMPQDGEVILQKAKPSDHCFVNSPLSDSNR